MERHLKEITTLAADLHHHHGKWGLNLHVTEAQRRLWPENELPPAALGTDNPNCLRLLKGDGYDGEPVGTHEKVIAIKFFSSEDHLFPPDRDLTRLGVFFHLGFFRSLHLVVKNQWEEFVVHEKRQAVHSRPTNYLNCLTKFEEGTVARLLDRFRLGIAERAGTEEIFLLFQEHGNMASKAGYDLQSFSTLVDQMIFSRVHYCGTASSELESFVARQEREITLLRKAAGEEEFEFWLKKCCWLAIRNEVEDKLLLREDIRLRNFNVTMEWMALFGPMVLELMETQMLLHQLERRIAIKRADPTLSGAEIDKRVEEGFEEELASLEKVKGDALRAASPALSGVMGEPMSDEALGRYREEAKKIMREIWRLTHPDTLDSAFTERQRERLREFLEQVLEIRKEEALLDVRAIPVLKEILSKVRELYDVMGIELEPESIIRGDTLADQIAWLENEIQKIERQSQELMAEIHAMTLDPEIREKMACMAGEENRKATMSGTEQRKKEMEAQIVVLQAEYQRMVNEGGTP